MFTPFWLRGFSCFSLQPIKEDFCFTRPSVLVKTVSAARAVVPWGSRCLLFKESLFTLIPLSNRNFSSLKSNLAFTAPKKISSNYIVCIRKQCTQTKTNLEFNKLFPFQFEFVSRNSVRGHICVLDWRRTNTGLNQGDARSRVYQNYSWTPFYFGP